jgi:UDP-2,4-diacetamido-2,4,6-trideoxy-beta-L-altropyranose hydrolase
MIIFRTNGGKTIGLGHLYRCLSLAKTILKLKPTIEIIFIINAEIEGLIKEFRTIISETWDEQDLILIQSLAPKVVVVDSYLSNEKYLSQLSKLSTLVQFDDNNDIYPTLYCKVLINGNIYAEQLKYHTKSKDVLYFLGPKYIILKDDIETNIEKPKSDDILITTGGSDPFNLMVKFISALKDLQYTKTIIVGPAYSDQQIDQIRTNINHTCRLVLKPSSLKADILKSLIVITASGSTIYEVFTLKRIPIIYCVAQNQKNIYETFKKQDIITLGWYNQIDWNALSKTINKSIASKTQILDRLNPLFSLYNGTGKIIIAQKIIELV